MELHELQKKSIEDLEKLLLQKQADLQELRFKTASGQLKEVRQIREARKIIAQINTLIGQKHKVA